jgi:hypothetical protein
VVFHGVLTDLQHVRDFPIASPRSKFDQYFMFALRQVTQSQLLGVWLEIIGDEISSYGIDAHTALRITAARDVLVNPEPTALHDFDRLLMTDWPSPANNLHTEGGERPGADHPDGLSKAG